MAETTTATWLPAFASARTRSATWRMRSMPAIDVPPNFITMRFWLAGGIGLLGGTGASCYGWLMVETSMSEGSTRATTSVVQEEIAQFGKLAGDWWDPNGASAM